MNNTAVVVITCDAYKKYWNMFYGLFVKYWPNCPYPIYHISENETYSHELIDIQCIQTKLPQKAKYWSEGVLIGLQNVKEHNIIFFLEDFFLYQTVDNKLLDSHIQYLDSHNTISCIRLLPIPNGTIDISNDYSEHIVPDFRISTQVAIWKKNYLCNLLQIDENPWVFEDNASFRSMKFLDKVIVVKNPKKYPIVYCNAVIKDKITRKAIEICNKAHIPHSFNKTEICSRIEEFYWNSKNMTIRKIIDFIDYRIIKFKHIW